MYSQILLFRAPKGSVWGFVGVFVWLFWWVVCLFLVFFFAVGWLGWCFYWKVCIFYFFVLVFLQICVCLVPFFKTQGKDKLPCYSWTKLVLGKVSLE